MQVLILIALSIVLIVSSEINTKAFSAKADVDKNFNIEELLQHKSKDVHAKADRLNRNFERMLQLVSILGQVDTFLTEKMKLMLRKLALLAEDDDHYLRRKKF